MKDKGFIQLILHNSYDKFKGTAKGAHSSKLYNESAFLLCLRSITHVITYPPAPFEKYIIAHYLENGKEIVRACESYLSVLGGEKDKEKEQGEKGHQQGAASAEPTAQVLLHTPSRGFCRALAMLYPVFKRVLDGLGNKEEGLTEKGEMEKGNK